MSAQGENTGRGRRRVRARQAVDVNAAGGGVSGSTSVTSALGRGQDNYNVYVGRDNGWAGVAAQGLSRTLEAMISRRNRDQAKADAEAERARARAERLEDQRQALEGTRAGMNINRELNEKIIRGEINNPLEADNFVNDYMNQIAGTAATPFYNAMYGGVIKGLEAAGNSWNAQLQADLTNAGRTMSAAAAVEAFKAYDLAEPGEFRAAIVKAKEVAVTHGVTAAAAEIDLYNAGLSVIREAAAQGDSVKAWNIYQEMMDNGMANNIPLDANGRSGSEILFSTVTSAVDSAVQLERTRENNARQAETQQKNDNYGKALAKMAAAQTEEQLAAAMADWNNLSGQDLWDVYGDKGSQLSVIAETTRNFLVDGRKPYGNDAALRDLQARLDAGDPTLIWEPGAMKAYEGLLTGGQLAVAQAKIYDARKQQAPVEGQAVLMEIKALHDEFAADALNKTGSTLAYRGVSLVEVDPINPGKIVGLTQEGMYVQSKMLEAYRGVNPALEQYVNDPTGYLLNRDRSKAMRDAGTRIKSGEDDGFYKMSKDFWGQEKVTKAIELYTANDIREDPQMEKAIDKAIDDTARNINQTHALINGVRDPELQQIMREKAAVRRIMPRLVEERRFLMELEQAEAVLNGRTSRSAQFTSAEERAVFDADLAQQRSTVAGLEAAIEAARSGIQSNLFLDTTIGEDLP